MKLNKKMLLLYVVTDRNWLKDGQTLSSVCEDVLANGATCIQLREKKLRKIFLMKQWKLRLCAKSTQSLFSLTIM